MENQRYEVVVTHLTYIREGMDGINERLDRQNGSIRDHGKAIAVLQWAVGLIGVSALAIFGAWLAKVWA